MVIDARVAATCVGEQQLAVAYLDAAEPGDLLLCERGFPAFCFFALLLASGIDFLWASRARPLRPQIASQKSLL